MSPIIRPELVGLSFFALAIAAQSQAKLEGRGSAQRFVSEKYGFSMSVPAGWSARLSPRDRPVYVNYPASRDLPQLRLPEGGAMIAVMANETSPGRRLASTLSEWAVDDMHNDADGSPTSPESFEMPMASGTKDAIILSYDSAVFGLNEQKQHHVAIYWEFDKKFFAAHLYYVAGDPKGTALERVFLSTVRSFRPLRSSGKR